MTEYIERDAALKAARMINVVPVPPTISESVNVVSVLDVLRIPAADVAPVVHARWELVYHDMTAGDVFKCTNCSGTVTRSETYRYCYGCGARMDGDANV